MDPLFLCEFCGGYFGDENQHPRVLSCGHTFCSQCINDFFKNGKFECLKCRCKHHTRRPGRIPANHTLLKIIKAKESNGISSGQIDMLQDPIKEADLTGYRKPPSSYSGKKSMKMSKTLEEPEQHAGKCVKHALYCILWCKRCREWICQDCTLVSHPPMRCHVLSFTEAIKEIKLDEDTCIRRTVQLFDRHAVIYREKLDTLREMTEKHRSLIQDLQILLAKHQNLGREVEKRELKIQDSLATGLSMLLMLMESQGHLLKAEVLSEVLLSRQSAQGCQSAILGWYEPRLLDDTEEIVLLDWLQKGTMRALAVLKHSMALSFNRRIVEESNGFTSLPENEQEGLVICLKCMIESPYWRKIFERTEGEDTVDGNSMYRLAQGTRRVDTRLNNFDFSKSRNFKATNRFSTNQNVRVEKLIDTDDDEWYQKFSKPGALANKGKVCLRPFSPRCLLDEITDDCYSQLTIETSKIVLGAEGDHRVGLTEELREVKVLPKHMIPLTPTKEGREFKLGVSGNPASRDRKILSKEFVMKLLNTEGRDIPGVGERDQFNLTDSEEKKTDSAFTTNSSKSIDKISNNRAKAVTLYPEWEGNPNPSAKRTHQSKFPSPCDTMDSTERNSQDYAHEHESFGEVKPGSRSIVLKGEAYKDSEHTDMFISNDQREAAQRAKGRDDINDKSSIKCSKEDDTDTSEGEEDGN